jgi:hypothetical protein
MLAGTRDMYQLITTFECSFLPSISTYKKYKKNTFWDLRKRKMRAVVLLVDLSDSIGIEETKKILMGLSNDPANPLPIVVHFPEPGKPFDSSDSDDSEKESPGIVSDRAKLETIKSLIKAGAGDVLLKCDQNTPMAIEVALMRTRLLWEEAEAIVQQEQEEMYRKLHVWKTEASYWGVVLPEVDPTLHEEVNAQGFTVISGMELANKLGSGAFAKVYKARSITTNQHCAVKVLQKNQNQKSAKAAMCEIYFLQKLPAHPHIPNLQKVLHSCDALYLCLDYGGPEDLYKLQKRCPQRKLRLTNSQEVFGQISDALLHVHRHKVCHRDIKPENIAMNGMKACLVDYGMAAETGKVLEYCCGSLPFAAPEVLDDPCKYYGDQADAFALGITLYEMINGVDSFFRFLDWKGAKEPSPELAAHVRAALANGVPETENDKVHSDLHEVIQGLIQINPTKRWDLDKVSQSMFLASAIAYEQSLPNMSPNAILGA